MGRMPEFIDLEERVTSWAWDMFAITANDKKIARDSIQLHISWEKVRIMHGDPEYTGQGTPGEPTSKVVFSTKFDNTTDTEHEYNFRAERTTRNSCSVDMSKCVTTGSEMSLTLKLPMEILEASAGFSRQVEVTKSTGQVFETEMTWSADSQIKLPQKSRTYADLVITQKDFAGNFKITTTFSGRVLVTFTNRKDNNSFIKCIEGDVAEIFRKVDGFTVSGRQVSVTNQGCCKFEYGVEQHITIRQEALPD